MQLFIIRVLAVALGTSAKKKFNKQLITTNRKIFWTFAKNAKALARLSVGHMAGGNLALEDLTT
jgi:hypothetical protein